MKLSQPQQPVKYAIPLFFVLGVGGLVLVLAALFSDVAGFPSLISRIPSLRPRAAVEMPSMTTNTTATLGGTLGDFMQRFGNSIDESSLMYAATLVGQRVCIAVALEMHARVGMDQEHIIAIDVQQVPGDALGVETWDTATADTITRTFLPARAQILRTASIFGETDHLYHSATQLVR